MYVFVNYCILPVEEVVGIKVEETVVGKKVEVDFCKSGNLKLHHY